MRIHALFVIPALVILASSEDPAAGDVQTSSSIIDHEEQLRNVNEEQEPSQTEDITLKDDPLKIEDPTDPKNSQLPILPPIILLDFGNDDDNSSSTDDKTKRTIDSNLGYGFARNNFFNGRTNYYFPAGKSGTTVSIEESISPYRPKTIIEEVKPISEKPESEVRNNDYDDSNPRSNKFSSNSGQRGGIQGPESPRNLGGDLGYSQPIFGQRTKLYKPSQIDYTGYRGFASTSSSLVESYTTPRTEYRGNNEFPSSSRAPEFLPGGQTTPSPFASYSTTVAPSFVTPTDTTYRARYNSNPGNTFGNSRPSYNAMNSQGSSLGHSPDSLLAPYANLPRYTLENGVRYENKIVWKYADGKISATPPTSYVNAYNEFLSKQNPGAAPPMSNQRPFGISGNLPNSGYPGNYPHSIVNYQNYAVPKIYPNVNYQNALMRYQQGPGIRVAGQSFGNIYSKSPAQFPNDQEPSKPMRPSQFVSSASLKSIGNSEESSNVRQSSVLLPGQSYDLGYEGQYGLKTSVLTGNSQSSTNSAAGQATLVSDKTKLLKDVYRSNYENNKPASKYEVNSPNPEYTYSTESSVLSSTTPSSLEISLSTPQGHSDYSTPGPTLLTKTLDSQTITKNNYEGTSGNGNPTISGINTDYENLLSYNPSISQYIKNPSSILKAQPTYIQAGNSLIPVIILRVDGAPPIQPKVTPNINLKALLQQYLTQYADNIGHNGKNEFQNGRPGEKNGPGSQSPIRELTRLTQTLSQYSRDPNIADQFAKQFSNNGNENSYDNSNVYPSRTSYGDRRNKSQKVKSVQIIDDPRFTSYKVNS